MYSRGTCRVVYVWLGLFFQRKINDFLHNNLSLAAKISSPERASVWTRPGLDANRHGGSQCRCMPLWIAPMQFYLT